VCNNFGLYTLLTALPTFFHDVYRFDIKSNGLVSSLPYLGLWIITLLSGRTADVFISKGILSITNTRRLFNTLGFSTAGFFLVLTGYSTTWQNAVAFVCLSVSCSGFAQAGYQVNHLDVAPLYAGLLMGFTNTLATIPGLVGPIMAESIAHSDSDIDKLRIEWRAVFFLLAGTYLFGAVVYVTLVSGEKQSWADGYTHPGKQEDYEFTQLHKQRKGSHTVPHSNEPNVDSTATDLESE
jgi:ACS family sodium-dependent inorganic phosphate cotransporter-like MFS transporter 5